VFVFGAATGCASSLRGWTPTPADRGTPPSQGRRSSPRPPWPGPRACEQHVSEALTYWRTRLSRRISLVFRWSDNNGLPIAVFFIPPQACGMDCNPNVPRIFAGLILFLTVVLLVSVGASIRHRDPDGQDR
jgi:hypothetical protein